MRIAVARLDHLLLVGELAAQVHLIVTVFAALRKERVEGAEELRHQVVAMMQPHRQALIEIPGRGVKRRVERAAVAAEDVAGLLGNTTVHVDGLEAALRRQGQRQFGRTGPNHA